MKPNYFSLAILLVVLLFTNCKKHSSDVGTTPAIATNPFGVLVNDSLYPGNINFKLSVARQYHVPYLRDAVNLSTWAGTDASYNSSIAAGFKIVLNVNNDQVQPGNPHPYPTDLVAYKAKLTSVFTALHPEVMVIENEETNQLYHSGSLTNYIAELQAATEVAHANGQKITNGGITAQIVLVICRDYYSRGMATAGADYASRTGIPANVAADMPGLTHFASLKARADSTEYLVNQYKTMALDYVNLHWYEPIADNSNPSAAYYSTKAFTETIDYLKRATGKTVITNEYGQDNIATNIVTDLLQAVVDAKLPYAIWYDGDGNSARALHETGTTNLRANGQAFTSFMQTHFQ